MLINDVITDGQTKLKKTTYNCFFIKTIFWPLNRSDITLGPLIKFVVDSDKKKKLCENGKKMSTRCSRIK